MNGGSILDLIFLGIIVLCVAIATIKGFFTELFEKGAPIIAIWMAILFYKKLAAIFERFLDKHLLAVILSFLAIFIVAFVILKIVQMSLSKLFETKVLSQLDHILGFVFGILEGLAVCDIILIILTAQQWFDVSELLSHSFFYKMLKPFIFHPVIVKPDFKSSGTAFLLQAMNGVLFNV